MLQFNLKKYNFRHLVLGITAASMFVLALLVAFISAQVAFNEMSSNLYSQSVNISHNLAQDSVAPLLYESTSAARIIISTLVNMQQISEVSIVRISNKPLLSLSDTDYQRDNYATVDENNLTQVIETDKGWYFSELVATKDDSGDLEGSFLAGADESEITVLGYVHLGVSKASIYQSRQEIFVRNFIAAAVTAIILLLFMYVFLRKLTMPLEVLSQLMEQGKLGQYPEIVDVQGTKEVTHMAHTFVAMIAAIKERELNLSLTLNSIGDAVIATDAEGLITRMNPVAENLTGWHLAEAKGLSVKDVFPIIDASTQNPIKNPVDRVLESGETVYLSNHTTLIAKDKTEYQIADSAAPIRTAEGKILGMVLVFNDVSEQYKLREAAAKIERDMQAVMDNTPATIYIKDLDGCYLFVNHAVEELYELKRDEFIGKTDYDIYSKDIAEGLRRNDKIVIDSKSPIELEEVIPLADGDHHYLSVKFPLFDADNNVYAMCGISTDITERIKQNEQLRRSQKMDALGKLTGGVAHDYNNMLGVVMGYAELLELLVADDPVKLDYVQKIYHAGERGAKLTKKLMSFSRQKKSDDAVVKLNTLLEDEKDMLRKVLTARINLKLELAPDLWPISLDVGDLEDAIVNICINAMHAIDGNGYLTIRTINVTLGDADARLFELQQSDYVRLSITDTGSGMDEATREKIFEPFFSTKGEKGTGLGLAQVYGFVERSGGSIQVYSEPGKGTEFVMYFPAYSDVVKSAPTALVEKISDFKGNEKILVVDDEAALLSLTCEVLERQGYETYAAIGALEALKILQNNDIDVMFSDVIMPNIDGYQLAAMVIEKYPKVKIQMASGFSDDRHIHIVDESLHLNLILKPYQSLTVLKKIRSLLDVD